MANSKFFEGTEDLVVASMRTLRILRKQQNKESRMAYESILLALCKMGVKIALKQHEQEKKDAA